MIIDCHAHVASFRSIPRKFYMGWAKNIVSKLPYVTSESDIESIMTFMEPFVDSDEYCDNLVQEMDAAGIDKTVLLMVDWGIVDAYEFPKLKENYKYHQEIINRHPGRFILFGTIGRDNSDEELQLFEQYAKEGIVKGLKLYPPCGYSPSDKRIFPYFELCEKYSLPVLTHVGPSSGNLSYNYTSPEDIDTAAHQFQDANFILGHAGFMRHEEAALIAEYRHNVFLDVSGFQNQINKGAFDSILAWHKTNKTYNKLIFGTDWPIHRTDGNQVFCVSAFKEALQRKVINEYELEMLFYYTPRKALFLD